jgi:hypothetical protein
MFALCTCLVVFGLPSLEWCVFIIAFHSIDAVRNDYTLFVLFVPNDNALDVPQAGRGCKVGEHMVRIEWDVVNMPSEIRDYLYAHGPGGATAAVLPQSTAMGGDFAPSAASTESAAAGSISKKTDIIDGIKFIPISDIAVSEKFTVLELKQLIHSQWSDLVGNNVTAALKETGFQTTSKLQAKSYRAPESPSHIRVRDMKGNKLSGPLRDDRVLSRCLLGLSDGRRLLIQTLETAEHIGADDLVLAVRVMSCANRTLSPPTDLPMRRSSTVKHLFAALLTRFPYLSEEPSTEELQNASITTGGLSVLDSLVPEAKTIAIAKGFTSGPPLNSKSALKLKFNDPAVCVAAGCDGILLDASPLNLRDGSVIVVYNQADFGRMQIALNMKKEALAAAAIGVDGDLSAAAVGTGASAAKATRARSARGSSRGGSRFRPPTEKSLKIDITGGGQNIGALLGGDQQDDCVIYVPQGRNHMLNSQSTPSLEQKSVGGTLSPPKGTDPLMAISGGFSSNPPPPQ